MKKFRFRSATGAVIVCLTVAGSANAAPLQPPMFYSGRLTQDNNPLTTSQQIGIDIKDGVGNIICHTAAGVVAVRDGYFRVPLDSTCPASLATNTNAYVYLSVGAVPFQGTMQGVQIGAVPFAVNASNADNLGGTQAASFVQMRDLANAGYITQTKADQSYLKLGAQAADSAMLGSFPAMSYAQRSDLTGLETSTHAAATYLTIGGKAADSSKLGGISAGQIIDANGVVLAAALPTSVPNAPSCGSGQLVQRTSTGWTCTNPTAAAPAPMTCNAGEVSKFNGSAWTCVAVPGQLRIDFVGVGSATDSQYYTTCDNSPESTACARMAYDYCSMHNYVTGWYTGNFVPKNGVNVYFVSCIGR
jgi:hypothetical protein